MKNKQLGPQLLWQLGKYFKQDLPIMGVFANLPIALAPGMSTNAYFAYTVVGFHGLGSITYQSALAAVLIEGVIFLTIAALGFRTYSGSSSLDQ